MAVKVTETTIEKAVKFDDQNANLGTPAGAEIIDTSIQERGLARPVVIGSDDGLIGGNKTTAAAQRAGITKAVIIETTGDTLVIHKRTDVALDSPEGRLLALEDNRSQEVNLNWDPSRIASFGVDVSHLWSLAELPAFAPPPPTNGEGQTIDDIPTLGDDGKVEYETDRPTPTTTRDEKVYKLTFFFEIDDVRFVKRALAEWEASGKGDQNVFIVKLAEMYLSNV